MTTENYDSPGEYRWTCPSGVYSIYLGMRAGAGGGSSSFFFGGSGENGFQNRGNDGGCGEYLEENVNVEVVPDQEYTIYVGSGGAGGQYATGSCIAGAWGIESSGFGWSCFPGEGGSYSGLGKTGEYGQGPGGGDVGGGGSGGNAGGPNNGYKGDDGFISITYVLPSSSSSSSSGS